MIVAISRVLSIDGERNDALKIRVRDNQFGKIVQSNELPDLEAGYVGNVTEAGRFESNLVRTSAALGGGIVTEAVGQHDIIVSGTHLDDFASADKLVVAVFTVKLPCGGHPDNRVVPHTAIDNLLQRLRRRSVTVAGDIYVRDDVVVTLTAIYRITSEILVDFVRIDLAAINDIVSISAGNDIVAPSAGNSVVASLSVNGVISATPIDTVATTAPRERVVTFTTVNRSHCKPQASILC